MPNGEHRNVPDPERIIQDIDTLVAPRMSGRPDGPVQPPSYVEVDLGEGLYYYRQDWHEGRGNFAQDGTFEEHYADFSDGDLIYDKPGSGRQSFKSDGVQVTSGATTPNTGRTQGGIFGGLGSGIVTLMDIGGGGDGVFKYTDTYDPVFATIPGFARPTGASYLLCSTPVQAHGAAGYAFGWSNATGPATSAHVITDLANPPTSVALPVGQGPVYGLTQTPIDNNALAIYYADATGGYLGRLDMIAVLGTATLENGKRLPSGGYAVGMVNLDGTPDLFYVVPADGQPFFRAQSGSGYGPFTSRNQLLRTDLRCSYGPQLVDLKLPSVVWATGMGNALAYCNGGRHHRWMTHGADIPIPGTDRPPSTAAVNGSIQVHCTGHHRYGEKFFWDEDEIDLAGVVSTKTRRFEYDSRLNRAWPVTPKVDTSNAGIRTTGGADKPVTSLGNLINHRLATNWTWQFQPPTGQFGTDLMHIDGAGSTSGRQFNQASARTTPRLRSRGHPSAVYVGARLTGPTLSQLRRGTTYDVGEALDVASCLIQIAGNVLPETVIFRATDATADEDYRPVYPIPANDNWQPYVQLTYTILHSASGTYSNRYSPVVDHLTLEGYFYDPAPPPPSQNYPNWGRNIQPPSNVMEAL